ncbi:DsbA family protein [Glaciibacter sp. 2TAF33]|uniref:DsbA family protein n=1 Tax=Glaciibacter sp. 2TAF33 TaxID=3233015 RepID=UPI003F914203
MVQSRRFRILVTAVAAVATLGLAGCTPAADSGTGSSASSAPLPTGTVGGAHFDDGFLSVGTGEKVVDVYFDPMCPICGTFEEANGRQLSGLVADGAITLQLHTMTFLNRASRGTDYSTRASAALTCVAAADASSTLSYFAALYADQPAENSSGLTDKQLISMANDAGAPDITECVTDDRYHSWVQQANDDALAGPIPGADIDAVTGTPTVLVNGTSYTGKVNDATALAAFISSN